jgi:3-hydroxyisobutyrate dehydrogenase
MSGGMAQSDAIGFIGLGVMGEPICRNLLKKSGKPIVAFDLTPEPLSRLHREGATAAASVAEVMTSDFVFCCLPSGKHLRALFEGKGGVLENARKGQIIVDLGTSPVALTRELASKLEARGVRFADAPIARTREAAINGTLSVMVGASPDLFTRVEPVIRHFATEVTSCGGIGAGQVTKILNNMVLFQTVNALAEAAAIARRSGVEPKLLFETLSKGSADSFALRNHGLKAMIPGEFPERAFSTEYALKDLSYALDLTRDVGLAAPGAELAGSVLQRAIDNGFGAAYWPVIARVVDKQ